MTLSWVSKQADGFPTIDVKIVKGSTLILEPPGAPRRAGDISKKTENRSRENTRILHWTCTLEKLRAARKTASVSFRSPADPAPFPAKISPKAAGSSHGWPRGERAVCFRPDLDGGTETLFCLQRGTRCSPALPSPFGNPLPKSL